MFDCQLLALSPADAATATVRVLFFGKVADVFGRSREIAIPTQGCSLPELRDRLSGLAEGGGAALSERGVRCALEQQIVGDEAWMNPGQEVAFFSMFSGG